MSFNSKYNNVVSLPYLTKKIEIFRNSLMKNTQNRKSSHFRSVNRYAKLNEKTHSNVQQRI